MTNRWGKSRSSDRFSFLVFSKITVDGDWSHEIKRSLLLGRKVVTNLVQFSRSVMSDSLRLHEPQHARPPCPSPIPRVYPNSCPLSQWCHPAISSSVVPFSSCLQSFPTSGSFQMSQLFSSGGQNIGASALPSSFPVNIKGLFPLGFTCLISLLSKGLSRVFSRTTVQRHQFFGSQPSLWSNSHIPTRLLKKG